MTLDRAIQHALRFGFRLLRLWWRWRPPRGKGAAIAVWHGDRLLVVRHSYRDGYGLPGGSIGRRESPAAAASRELREETGVDILPDNLRIADEPARGIICRGHTAYLFEVRVGRVPALRIDNREIVEARFVAPSDAKALGLSAQLRRYLSSHYDRAA